MATQTQNLPAKQGGTLATVQQLLEKYSTQIAVALPKHMTPERMIRVALTAVSQTPRLLDCNPYTICGAVVQASILGLEPNSTLGEAFLVPYWNNKTKGYDCQLQVGYKGHVKLARNSGEIAMVDAQPVCEGDDFEFAKGDTPYLKHKWSTSGARGNRIGYWAGFKTKDGTFNFEYWTIEDIYAHRDRFTKSKDREGKIYGPWADNEDWMCRKTVLIQCLKLAPKSVQLATAIGVDEHPNGRFSLDVPLEFQPVLSGDDEPTVVQPLRKSEIEAPAEAAADKKEAKPSKPPAKLYDYADWERAQESPDMGSPFIKVAGNIYVFGEGGNYQAYKP